MGGVLPGMGQQRLYLRRPQIEAFPQLCFLGGGEPARRDATLDLVDGAERRLLVALGVAEAVIREAARQQRHLPRPVPGRPQRDALLLDGGRTQPLAAPAFGLGPAIDVALQVGQLQLAYGEPLAEGGEQVLEMQLDPSTVRSSRESRCVVR